MSLSYNELKPGTFIIFNNEPYEVKEADFLRMQQRKPVMRTRLRNLKTGKIAERSFKPDEKVEEAAIEKIDAKFFYQTKSEVCFQKTGGEKLCLSKEELGDKARFLTKETPVTIVEFEGEPISVEAPIKVALKVAEAEEAVRGNTASGGITKEVELETGASLQVPLFIKEGDIVMVNTETGEYVERVN